MDKDRIMIKAATLRKRLGEDSDSPIDIFALAQDIDGLTLVFYPMSDKISGMCIKGTAANANVIAINSAMTLGRQRYSLAHELYHLFYDEQMSSVCAKKIAEATGNEKEADSFASYFLMPPASLQIKVELLKSRNENNNLTVRDVVRLEQHFGVSHQAMLIRLKEDGHLSATECENMQIGVKRIAERMGFPTTLYSPTAEDQQYATYGNYLEQVEQVFDKDLISTGKYDELLLDAFRADLVFGSEDEGGELLD